MVSDATREHYRHAVYRIGTKPVIDMKIGACDAALDALLAAHAATSAVFVTAFNPFGRVLGQKENARRQRVLNAYIERTGLVALPGAGIDPKGEWRAETSLFVLNAARELADALLRTFEQNAVVYVDRGAPPWLLWHPAYR